MGLTLELATQTAQAGSRGFSAKALEWAKIGFMDTLATTIAGSQEEVTQKAMKYALRRASSHGPACRLPWTQETLSAEMAALVFGTAAHALDYDDVAIAGHPSAVLVPAIVSDAISRRVSGRSCLEAYVVGYETWGELFRREPGALHEKGWHPTAVYGVIGATAALAYLRGLSEADTATALAIAGSLASGLVANFGTMMKPIHAGRAAAMAFEALELTALGVTASADALEHASGFLNAISPACQADRSSPIKREDDWLITQYGLCIKQYPVCYGTHRCIDAALDVAQRADIQIADIERVRVGLGKTQSAMLRNARPVTGLEAKFSIQFAMAAAFDRRTVSLGQLTDEYVLQPHIQSFYSKVETWTVQEPDSMEPAFSRYDIVEVTLKDGSHYSSGEVQYARGHAQRPLTLNEMRAKFFECFEHHQKTDAGSPLVKASPDRMFDQVAALDACGDMASLFSF